MPICFIIFIVFDKGFLVETAVRKSSIDLEEHQRKIFGQYGEYFAIALLEWSKFTLKNEIHKIKVRHTKKLKDLNAIDPFDKFNIKHTVINLSGCALTKEKFEALSLGLNMSWPNYRLDEIRFQSELEAKYNLISKKVPNTNEIHTDLKHAFLDIFQTSKTSIKHYRPSKKVSIKQKHM